MTTREHIPFEPPPRLREDFAVVVEDVGAGDVQVQVVGELDRFTAVDLAGALAGLCGAVGQPAAAPHGGTVVLDLSRMSFIDSAGVRGLLDSQRRLAAYGWRVCPTGAQQQVGWLLDYADRNGWLPHDFLCADIPLQR